ncbi:hypothetical protein Z043_119187 [Scleropages formosus]|uniref:Uncharacterized protein n=1 Tax=Scleropages formosus TaxID=113540 RepID=A0A0P7TYC8_SCLFO|nr:hypothetical protein Z043_119187 [Scleropages formosus]
MVKAALVGCCINFSRMKSSPPPQYLAYKNQLSPIYSLYPSATPGHAASNTQQPAGFPLLISNLDTAASPHHTPSHLHHLILSNSPTTKSCATTNMLFLPAPVSFTDWLSSPTSTSASILSGSTPRPPTASPFSLGPTCTWMGFTNERKTEPRRTMPPPSLLDKPL